MEGEKCGGNEREEREAEEGVFHCEGSAMDGGRGEGIGGGKGRAERR